MPKRQYIDKSSSLYSHRPFCTPDGLVLLFNDHPANADLSLDAPAEELKKASRGSINPVAVLVGTDGEAKKMHLDSKAIPGDLGVVPSKQVNDHVILVIPSGLQTFRFGTVEVTKLVGG